MKKLEHRDQFLLEAAGGWLMLGNTAEAAQELTQIDPAVRSHPDVLLVDWEIAAHKAEWDRAITIADTVIARAPERPDGFVKKAYALHELKRTEEAWNCLHPLSAKFQQWIIPYNLACYACQLGKHHEALSWFRRALRVGDKRQLRSMALGDPDLKPLAPKIQKLGK